MKNVPRKYATPTSNPLGWHSCAYDAKTVIENCKNLDSYSCKQQHQLQTLEARVQMQNRMDLHYASSSSSMRSPGANRSPCFSLVLPLHGSALTFKPSSSPGTDIFISIFIDSNTTKGSPSFKTSPTFTL